MAIVHLNRGDIEYRIEKGGPKAALLLYGGHTSIHTHLGEDFFLARGYTILVVSRPGYGKTQLSTGRTPDAFADALAELLEKLNISRVLLVGISGGGPAAMRFAAKHHEMTDKLILQSSISFAPWPNRLTRLGSYIVFNPLIERYAWKLMRLYMKRKPKAAVRMMLSNMSTRDPAKVVNGMRDQQLKELADVFMHLGSGSGFMNDIQTVSGNATDVKAPTLIIHSRYDKSVPLRHAYLLADQIKDSKLYVSEAESHMIWFSPQYEEIENVMDNFLSQGKP